MGLSTLGAIPIGIGVSAFIASILVAFLLINAPQERLARTLAYSLTGFAVWGWFSFAYFLTNDPDTARTFRLLSLVGQIPGQIFSIRYFYVYLESYRPIRPFEDFVQWLLIFANIALLATPLLDIFLQTALVFGPVLVTAAGTLALAPQPSLLAPLHAAGFLIVPFIGIWIMLPRIRHETGSARRVGIIVLSAFIGAYVAGGTGYLTWYEIETPLVMLRGIGIPLFVVLAAYTISNYQLFNVRVAAAEIFVFLMWGFIFWRTLLNPSLAAATPDIILFIASIVVGLLFIRSITNDLKSRIELEKVSGQLRVLNSSLEEEVDRRTGELRRAKKHTDSVVEHLPVGLIEILADSTIVRANAVTEEILALDAKALLNTKAHEHAVLKSMLNDPVVPGIREVHVDSPKSRDLEVSVAPLVLEEGEGHVIILRDVTERRALERAKNDFVATAAHQLRTPLSAIKWTFDLLSGDPLPAEQAKQVLERGGAAVKNMTHIAEGLMMSIRTAEGVSKYTFKDADYNDILKQSTVLVQSLAQQKNITLKTNIASPLPHISVDSERMIAATQNLLDNAIKYTPEGGVVTLKARADAQNLTVSITDTGIGISKEDQEHIFERFFRAHDAVEISTDGSGLGLSIVKSIITAHGGKLDFKSEPGSGSMFTYTLPVHQ